MNPNGSRWILSLCLVLSMALALKGAPTTTKNGKLQRSEWNAAGQDPTPLKLSGKAEIPILPPDENLEAMKLGSDESQGDADLEDDYVSGDDHVSGSELEGISGDDSIDYSDFHFPFRVTQSEIGEVDNQGNEE